MVDLWIRPDRNNQSQGLLFIKMYYSSFLLSKGISFNFNKDVRNKMMIKLNIG